jgi:RimJ/RimL family protein N-acetyltransferase
MSILTPPGGALADDVVTLRLPSPDAGDVAAVDSYVQQEQLEGGWLPDVPLVTGRQLVADWLDGWSGNSSHNGPAFVVTVPDHPQFVGIVGMSERDEETIAISYGTAPGWRGRGLASHAVRLGAGWIARQTGVRRVEARVSQGDRACERVAVKAGFEFAAPVPPIAGTGQVADDMLYVLNRPGMGGR